MLSRILTERRTPNPVNINFPGEKTFQVSVRLQIPHKVHVVRRTRLTPSPRTSENVCRTFTVGLRQLVHRSSLLGGRSSPRTCLWRTARIMLGELQSWSSTASGWARRSILVRFSYAFKALLKISWNLSDEFAVVVVVVVGWEDIRMVRSFVRAQAEPERMAGVSLGTGAATCSSCRYVTSRRANLTITKYWKTGRHYALRGLTVL